MPAPTTVDEFVDLVRKSNVLDEPRLATYVEKLRGDAATPKDLSGVAGLFVRDGLLTYFQAEQFLQGRWKRFTIGKYKVLEKLGSGGMGQVFLCEHKLMRRRVAVKVLPTAKAADPSSLERFYREARAVAALDHPNIVRAYDIDQDDNLHFIVMEYVDGSSLQDIIRKAGPMDVTRACHYMYWSAVGLQSAHESGLIHRDIKPGNILVDRLGVVKILDLGLARFFNDDEDLLTKKYDENVLGTADYLAPEQAIDSHTVDGRADIYSLGATFYFLLTGAPPFADGTIAQKLLWHQNRNPKPIRDARPNVPADVAAVLTKMMAKKPENRYQTPTELSEALLPFTQTPIPAPPEKEMPQLSAAAMGAGVGGSTMVLTAPRTMNQAPRPPVTSTTLVAPRTPAPAGLADAETRKTPPIPVVEPIPDSIPGSPNWAVISAETANTARTDTDRKKKEAKSNRKVKPKVAETQLAPKAPEKPSRKKQRVSLPILILTIAGALILLIGGAYTIYVYGFRSTTKPTGAGLAENRRLIVTHTPNGNPLHFGSIKEAWDEFRPGDTMVMQDEDWEESQVIISGKRAPVLIAAEGKRVIWKTPAGKTDVQSLLALHNAEGGRVSGISFQCDGRASVGVRISGKCGGLILEDVEFGGATTAGIEFHDADGEKGRPITVRKARFHSAGKDCKTGVIFTGPAAPPKAPRGPSSDELVLANCLIEGPFTQAGFQFEAGATGIEIRHCRFWRSTIGIQFRKKPEAVWQVHLTANTFHTLTAGLQADDIASLSRPENKIKLTQNFFADCGQVLLALPVPVATTAFAESAGNFRKIGNGPGTALPPPAPNVPGAPMFPTEEIAVPDLPANPNEPTKFLVYDRAHPLARAYLGKPVGAPPE